jgi:oligosaccharyltransferase complex subunit alpha (ribophorin I)
MAENASATLVVNSVLVHASTPFPATVKQGDPQSLKFSIEAYVLSPYKTISERTKIRYMRCPLNPGIMCAHEYL